MVTVSIKVASFFVVCTALDSDLYTVPKLPSSYSPFGSKYVIKLIFEENTFEDDDAVLEFKVCSSN